MVNRRQPKPIFLSLSTDCGRFMFIPFTSDPCQTDVLRDDPNLCCAWSRGAFSAVISPFFLGEAHISEVFSFALEALWDAL